jgi:CRP/FNR family cyclic AMP-dependent transcriptional regulator
MNWIDAIGYLASALVFVTFCMRTMIPLRIVAIASNLCFVAYGFFGHVYPVLFLHLILLPMNGWRTIEMMRLVRRVQAASKGDLSIEALRPFMTNSRCTVGDILFCRGDDGDRLFFILEGELEVEESGNMLRPGSLFGEIALFSPTHRRTQTARCLTDVELLWITEKSLAQVCYQSPAVSFHLLRLIAAHLLGDVRRLEAERKSGIEIAGRNTQDDAG